MKYNILIPFIIIFLSIYSAQKLQAQDTVRLAVRGVYEGGKVILRWAPQDIASWKYVNTNGFKLERKTLRSGGSVLKVDEQNASYVLLASNLIMLPENQWESIADTNNMAGIAASMVYGDSLDLLPVEGGGLLQVYNKARELDNRFGFSLYAADQDINVAKAMGLAFEDNGVSSENQYIYELTANGSAVTINGYTSVETYVNNPNDKPTGLKASASDKSVTLSWNKQTDRFSSFVVERATGVSGAFVRLNISPLMYTGADGSAEEEKMSYIDSLANNTTVYVYRVRGKTPFGTLSPASDTVQVKGKPGALSFLMSIKKAEELATGQLTLTWEFPDSLETLMTGFEISRSGSFDEKYVKLNSGVISMSTRTFVDANPSASNYYVVKAKDLNGYEYSTFPFMAQARDENPPSQPMILSAACNEIGVVTLHWAKNPDTDIMGYRVFSSTSLDGEYAQVTGTWINDTVYRYQTAMNTLSEELFFGIKAVDYHQNTSIMSAPFSVMRPDVVPPAPPVIRKAEGITTGVHLEWDLSPSADVASYYLERRNVFFLQWERVFDFDIHHYFTAYTDTSASIKDNYEYRLVAVDDAGLETASKIIKVKRVDTGLRHAIENFAGQLLQNPKKVVLQWDYMDDPDLIGFEIFRAVEDINKQRSYDYIKIPPTAPGGAVSNTSGAGLVGNNWHCFFSDLDVKFNIPNINNFVAFPGPNVAVNQSVPPPVPPAPGANTTASVVVVPNPNNLAGQQLNQPHRLYYWVMAKYHDGAFSPVAGPVMINFQ